MSNRLGKIDVEDISGPGEVPLGALIGIASNLAGAHPIPATGVMDSSGYQYCDGAAISGSASMTGTMPNLTDSRFLMGSTSAGAQGGQTNVSLSTSNMPSHTHGMQNHTHGFGTGGPSNNSTDSEPNHSHEMRGFLAGGGGPVVGNIGSVVGMGSYQDWNSYTYGSGGHSHSLNNHTHSGTTNGPNNNTTTSTGSGSSFNNRPQYLAVQYLMRVK